MSLPQPSLISLFLNQGFPECSDFADVYRAGAAAASDEAGARFVPDFHVVFILGRASFPGFASCIVVFAGVRIDDDGLVGDFDDFLDQGFDILRRGAVDADGSDFFDILQRFGAVGDEVAPAGVESVLAGEGNPCFCARDFRKDVGFCQRFDEAGNRFTGKDIGACFRQNVDSFSVEIGEFFSRLAIVPSVFRAVSKVSAVRTDGGSGQGCRAVFFFMGGKVFIPGILHESDGALDEGCRFFLGEPLLLESVDVAW